MSLIMRIGNSANVDMIVFVRFKPERRTSVARHGILQGLIDTTASTTVHDDGRLPSLLALVLLAVSPAATDTSKYCISGCKECLLVFAFRIQYSLTRHRPREKYPERFLKHWQNHIIFL